MRSYGSASYLGEKDDSDEISLVLNALDYLGGLYYWEKACPTLRPPSDGIFLHAAGRAGNCAVIGFIAQMSSRSAAVRITRLEYENRFA